MRFKSASKYLEEFKHQAVVTEASIKEKMLRQRSNLRAAIKKDMQRSFEDEVREESQIERSVRNYHSKAPYLSK